MSLRSQAAAVLRLGSLRFLGAVAALLLPGPAHAQYYTWPANGAPLCNAPGDQHRLFHSSASCGSMSVSWVHSVPGADSVVMSWIGPVPPAGECEAFLGRADAAGVTEASGTIVRSGVIALVPVPGCFSEPSAQVWLQGSGAAQQLVVHSPIWFGHERQVADDGDAVRHHPRMSGTGIPFFMDTALVVVWSDERTGVPQIRAQRVTRSGLRDWGPAGILIAPTASAQTHPEISTLEDGSTLVVWLEENPGGSDVYALRLLPDGSPVPGWPPGGLALESRPEVSGSPRLVHSPLYPYYQGYVVWEESGQRFGGGRSIVARLLEIDGTPDPGWSPDGLPLTSSPTVEQLEDATLAGTGLVAVWTDTRSATVANPTDLYAQWIDPVGAPAPGWPASGLAVCAAPGRQDAARVSAATSYAAFAWEDHRNGGTDIYTVLRYANAAPPCCLWEPDGLPATNAPGDQTTPVVGAGNSGGAFVAWVDARDAGTLGLDVYAQAFNGEGEKLDAPSSVARGSLLSAPRPNPARTSCRLTLRLPREGNVLVEVIDLLGRRVRTLARGSFPAGPSLLSFDGLDDAGRRLPPAVYRVRARFGGATDSQALILAR